MIELSEILDFFQSHPPFDQLDREQLKDGLRGLQAEYFPKGGEILKIGQENHLLHVVRSGAIELHNNDDDLVALPDYVGGPGGTRVPPGPPT